MELRTLYVCTVSNAVPSIASKTPLSRWHGRMHVVESGHPQTPMSLTPTPNRLGAPRFAPVSSYTPRATNRIRQQRPYPVTGAAV